MAMTNLGELGEDLGRIVAIDLDIQVLSIVAIGSGSRLLAIGAPITFVAMTAVVVVVVVAMVTSSISSVVVDIGEMKGLGSWRRGWH